MTLSRCPGGQGWPEGIESSDGSARMAEPSGRRVVSLRIRAAASAKLGYRVGRAPWCFALATTLSVTIPGGSGTVWLEGAAAPSRGGTGRATDSDSSASRIT